MGLVFHLAVLVYLVVAAFCSVGLVFRLGFFLGIYSYRGGHSRFDKTYFSYKLPIAVRVENHLNMLNSPIFPQLFLLMY